MASAGNFDPRRPLVYQRLSVSMMHPWWSQRDTDSLRLDFGNGIAKGPTRRLDETNQVSLMGRAMALVDRVTLRSCRFHEGEDGNSTRVRSWASILLVLVGAPCALAHGPFGDSKPRRVGKSGSRVARGWAVGGERCGLSTPWAPTGHEVGRWTTKSRKTGRRFLGTEGRAAGACNLVGRPGSRCQPTLFILLVPFSPLTRGPLTRAIWPHQVNVWRWRPRGKLARVGWISSAYLGTLDQQFDVTTGWWIAVD
jgi:hypothetical protein